MAAPPAAHIRALIHASDASIGAISAWLDSLTDEQRAQCIYALNRRDQRRLYQLAADGPAVALDDFVGAAGARVAVRNLGKNTLPLPGFTRFEKRFCRPEDGSARLFGYNEGASRPFIGPGYFVAIPTAGNPEWEKRGAIVVDYFQVPDGRVADGWPRVRKNHVGLQILVYYHTRDFMRRVSKHITVGAAYKNERALDHYFMLCRLD
jgi:hypothetical protein